MISCTGLVCLHKLKKTLFPHVPFVTPSSKQYKRAIALLNSVPDRPWSKVGADLLVLHRKQYIILVNYYLGFVEVDFLTKTTNSHIIKCCFHVMVFLTPS